MNICGFIHTPFDISDKSFRCGRDSEWRITRYDMLDDNDFLYLKLLNSNDAVPQDVKIATSEFLYYVATIISNTTIEFHPIDNYLLSALRNTGQYFESEQVEAIISRVNT